MKLAIFIAVVLLHTAVAYVATPPKKPQCVNDDNPPEKKCLDPKTIKCRDICIKSADCAYCNMPDCPWKTNPACGPVVEMCMSDCHYGRNAKNCTVCICPSDTKSTCPQLTSCRDGCSYALDKEGCPYCDECPDQGDNCPMFKGKCVAGSIMGNPEDGCDVCVPPPKRIPFNPCPREACIGGTINVPGQLCPICITHRNPCPRIACSRTGCVGTPETYQKCPECDCSKAPPCPKDPCPKNWIRDPEVNGMPCPECKPPTTYGTYENAPIINTDSAPNDAESDNNPQDIDLDNRNQIEQIFDNYLDDAPANY